MVLCSNFDSSYNRLVGGLEVLLQMEGIPTDKQDKPKVGQISITLMD